MKTGALWPPIYEIRLMNWLCLIPARKGSKGVPGKNIAPVAGLPLIAHTIRAARTVAEQVPGFTVFVSTDSSEIRRIAEAEGVDVPFLRPDEISGDKAPSIQYVLHALEAFERRGQGFEFVMILQPTSPLRPVEVILEAVRLMERSPDCDSLITAYAELGINPEILYRKSPDGRAVPLSDGHGSGGRRQDAPSVYVRNGAIYAVRTKFLRAHGQLIGASPILLEMDASVSVNIDTPADMERVRRVLEK